MGKEELIATNRIDDEKLPQIIKEQFAEVDAIKQQITLAREKAEEAKSKSENLHKVGIFGGGKKLAIEDLQESAKMMAEAQEQTAIAQGLFFDYQEKLAKATKWLFSVCVNNAANTQTVIRQLEIYMEGGNADDLDELKQNEINAVIDQLLQQESMQQKQEKMWDQIDSMDLELAEKTKKDESQDEEIARQAAVDEELGKRIDEGVKKDESQDEEIARQAAVDEELGKRIDEGVKKDESQDEEIARQAAVDEELGKRIDEGVKKDESQDEEIARQAAVDEELGKRIDEGVKKDESQDEEIARQAAVDKELGKRIDEGVKKDESQDEEIARQAAVDEELGKRIDEGVKKDESQDEEIARQAAIDEKLANSIDELKRENLEKDAQIKELKAICDKLSIEVNDNLSLVEDKEKNIIAVLKNKASIKALLISYIIGCVSFIAAIIQFFI